MQVANYIHQQTDMDFQCIVISLKEEFYSHADALVGIFAEVCSFCSSAFVNSPNTSIGYHNINYIVNSFRSLFTNSGLQCVTTVKYYAVQSPLVSMIIFFSLVVSAQSVRHVCWT